MPPWASRLDVGLEVCLPERVCCDLARSTTGEGVNAAKVPAPVTAVFACANGFTPAAYRVFFDALGPGVSLSTHVHPALCDDPGPPPLSLRWRDIGDDIAAQAMALGAGPVVGIGHSLGATALLHAAGAHPEVFRAIVAIEPATVGPWLAALDSVVPFGLRRSFEPARSTLVKTDRWPTLDAAFRTYREDRAFRRFDDAALRELVAAMTKPDGNGGLRLTFARAWEAHFYMCPPYAPRLARRLRCDALLIRGRPSLFLTPPRWTELERAVPHGQFESMADGGHLLPLEAPQACAAPVRKFLRDLERPAKRGSRTEFEDTLSQSADIEPQNIPRHE